MRTLLVVLLFLSMAVSSLAQELGNSRSRLEKPPSVQPPALPSGEKQGGDTVNDAFPIFGLPFGDTGTTAGYVNNYDWECPFDSMSPDVVYRYEPDVDIWINVDLCGSLYDTKTFVYDADLNVIGCNEDYYYDDECGLWVSFLEGVFLAAGSPYYIVIDGYGGDYGQYVLEVTEYEQCQVTCAADAVAEGEPPLHDGYVDLYNPGCNYMGGPGPILQEIDWTNDADGLPPFNGEAWLCGKSGWFFNPEGFESRDTDWYQVFALETGVMEFTVESERPCYIFKLAPLDCANVGVELQAEADCDLPATLAFPVTAGEEIWLWVGPTVFQGPVMEFTYFMTVSNNQFDVVPAEQASWGEVKSLYR